MAEPEEQKERNAGSRRRRDDCEAVNSGCRSNEFRAANPHNKVGTAKTPRPSRKATMPRPRAVFKSGREVWKDTAQRLDPVVQPAHRDTARKPGGYGSAYAISSPGIVELLTATTMYCLPLSM